MGAAKKNPAPTTVANHSISLVGMVNEDRLFLHGNDDQVGKVENPNALKGHEGLAVAVRCNVNSERESMRILSVRTEKPVNPACKGDSAFRR